MGGNEEVGAVLVLVVLALLVGGAGALWRWAEGRRHGRLVYADDSGRGGGFSSSRYRLVGRPDEVRRMADGRPVPVEWKSRPSPPHGPPASHQVQVWAYCLLLEDVTGFRPPYGVLRYSDGTEYRLPWDDDARARLLILRREVGRPYDGRADPGPAKCARCRWRPGCDARAPLPAQSVRWVR
ncbi:MAG: PD-(D/E)XK nuclease family protein [Thermoplasmata archaeon]|nr:PD-(D/E)XK nuclease family protein [Thermoplasmata archaeon]MCI4359602.1 PD-(D/E)XK nuclease family protein [Thermoplasmata archaeon]